MIIELLLMYNLILDKFLENLRIYIGFSNAR